MGFLGTVSISFFCLHVGESVPFLQQLRFCHIPSAKVGAEFGDKNRLNLNSGSGGKVLFIGFPDLLHNLKVTISSGYFQRDEEM